GGHIILNLLERGEHGFTVGSDCRVIGGFRFVVESAASADVKKGHQRGSSHRPNGAGALEQCADGTTVASRALRRRQRLERPSRKSMVPLSALNVDPPICSITKTKA